MSDKIHTALNGMIQDTTNAVYNPKQMELPFMVTRGNNIISLSIGDPVNNKLLTVNLKPILKELLELLSQEVR